MSVSVIVGAFAMITGHAGVVGFVVGQYVFWTAQLIVNRLIARTRTSEEVTATRSMPWCSATKGLSLGRVNAGRVYSHGG